MLHFFLSIRVVRQWNHISAWATCPFPRCSAFLFMVTGQTASRRVGTCQGGVFFGGNAQALGAAGSVWSALPIATADTGRVVCGGMLAGPPSITNVTRQAFVRTHWESGVITVLTCSQSADA